MFECFGVCFIPGEGSGCFEQVGEGRKYVRLARPHVAVVSDKAKESAKLFYVLG